MSFKSVLSGIGHFMEKAFSPNAIQLEAGIVDIALPQFTALTNAAASAIINVENASIVAGKQNGTGEQKAALVVSAIETQYDSFAAANNIPVIPAAKRKYVDAAVAMLNSFPFPTNIQPAPATATSGAIPVQVQG
jgi:hypothetical protein